MKDLRQQIETDAHLKEYESLREEIREYMQRIDRYVGIYLAASFGVIAVFLRPGADYAIASFVDKFERDPYSLGFLLLIPILNSILQIHLLSFMHAILAMAKYSTYVLGGRISRLARRGVFSWDKKLSVWDKGPWISTRVIAGGLYNLLILLISLSIVLYYSRIVYELGKGLLYGLYITGIASVSLAIACLIRYLFVSIKFHRLKVGRVPRLGWIMGSVLVLLIVAIIVRVRCADPLLTKNVLSIPLR